MGPLRRDLWVQGAHLVLEVASYRRGQSVEIASRWAFVPDGLDHEGLQVLETERTKAVQKWAMELGVRVQAQDPSGGRVDPNLKPPDGPAAHLRIHTSKTRS